MATAVQTNNTEPQAPNPRTRLAFASVLGALFVLAGIGVAAYLVPQVWKESVSPTISQAGPFVDVALRLLAQIAAVTAVIWLGSKLAGDNPPRGLRGGIFLAISTIITIFFVTRAVWMNTADLSIAMVVTGAVLIVALFLGYRFLVSDRGVQYMHALEEQGWFSTFSHKRSQGIKARRYTLLGILLVGWSGVWAIVNHEPFGRGDWNLQVPFTDKVVTVLSDIEYSIPLLLAALTFWVAWRAVNLPTFGDFLIATEAEMNKVSWSSRRRLVQDTIVVLVTVILLTLFLLVVDMFWGWLLSLRPIGVLPPQTQQSAKIDPIQGKKVDW
jgi:preprotein translocase SecE subunit